MKVTVAIRTATGFRIMEVSDRAKFNRPTYPCPPGIGPGDENKIRLVNGKVELLPEEPVQNKETVLERLKKNVLR